MSLNREAFLKPVKVPEQVVDLPEMGGSVRVRGFTAKQRSEHERSFVLKSGKVNQAKQAERRERLIIQTVIDDEGNPLFTEEDIPAIGRQPAVVIERLVDAALEVCGLAPELEDSAKNSEETQTDS